jgi:multidrug resistance efflux pump
MRLRRNAGSATPLPGSWPDEASPATIPSHRRSISRAVYLGLLAAGLCAALYSLMGYATFVEAPGVVDGGEAAVGVERTGRLERVFVMPGQEVKKGDRLAELSVLTEHSAAERVHREAQRLRAEAAGELERAAAKARERAASDLAEAARLRDDALRARADAGQARHEQRGLKRQIAELDEEIAAREELRLRGVIARSALVDLRVRRHALVGDRDGQGVRRRVLEENAVQLEAAALRLEDAAAVAPQEAIAGSNLASLEARAAQLDAEARQHEGLATQVLLAPVDGRIAWLEARSGEVVQPGSALVTLLPDSRPTVIAWPGAGTDDFPIGARVQVRGEGFAIGGTVEDQFLADRAKPRSLLRPYEREAVEAAILIRLDEAGATSARVASMVQVRRPRLSWLERWLVPAPTAAPERVARR